MRVGFVGLGNIGKPMAKRLAAADDLHLSVFDIAAEPVAELVQAGAESADSVVALAAQSEVICVMVRDDEQVREVLSQIIEAQVRDRVVLVHSTVAPSTPAELVELGRVANLEVLDAPVSGGAMGAAEGTLALMVGGSDVGFERARPVLQALGSKVVHAGPIGSGTIFKLARNLMHFVAFTAATEAQRLAEAAGLDLVELGAVVRHTDAVTGGPGAIMHRSSAAPIEEGDFWQGVFGHVAALGEKDLGFALDLARQLKVETPLAELALARLRPGLGLS